MIKLRETPLPTPTLKMPIRSEEIKSKKAINPKYEVYWRDKPASTFGFPHLLTGQGWDEYTFDTFEEALQYANDWMTPNFDGDRKRFKPFLLKPDEPLDYSGQGHYIEIRTIKNDASEKKL